MSIQQLSHKCKAEGMHDSCIFLTTDLKLSNLWGRFLEKNILIFWVFSLYYNFSKFRSEDKGAPKWGKKKDLDFLLKGFRLN